MLFADDDGESNTMVGFESGIRNEALLFEEAVEVGKATTSPNGIFNWSVNSYSEDHDQNYPNPDKQNTIFPYHVRN